MTASTLKTTVVGSYPVPEWLKGSPSPQSLRDAIRLVLDAQERAGIDVISDGELGRWDLSRWQPAGMVERFVRPMSGVQVGLSRSQREEFLADPATSYRAKAPGVVVDRLGEGNLDLLREFQQACSLTTSPLKFTLTSPYMLARVVADHYYKDLENLAMAFAEVLANQLKGINAAVVQVDEPHLPGHSGHSLLAAAAINRVLESVEDGVSRAVHLCFGNFGGQQIQRGEYGKLIDFLNLLECDHVVLETTRRTQTEIDALKDIDERIGLGVGVIDVKDLQVEAPEKVASRIDFLAERLGADRLKHVHPDCGLQVLPRPIADAKLRALVTGRDLFLGQRNNS